MKANNSEILDRLPPQNVEAERGVLGSLLLDPQACDDVALIVREGDFYGTPHQRLFRHVLGMHNEGLRVDVTLLAERLTKAGDLDLIGGMNCLEAVLQAVPSAANASHYARIVRHKAALRGIIHASGEAIRDAYDQAAEPGELAERLERRVSAAIEHNALTEPVDVEAVLPEVFHRFEQRATGDSDGLPTGFPDLDALTGGLHPSELTILAARPGIGKTALAGNIAEPLAVECGKAVLFVSLEMSRFELVERLVCGAARLSAHKARAGLLSPEHRRKLVEMAARFHGRRFLIDDAPSRTVGQIAAIARKQRRKGLDALVIDYLQLIEPDSHKDPRQEQVAKIARRLKGLARELSVPVLCLAQLNRQVEQAKENRPRLSHLRESGAIEQDADVVLLLHRPELNAPDDADLRGTAKVIVAKNRHGPTGDVDLVWISDQMRFEARAYDF